MKKVLSFVLCAVLVVTCICSCTKQDKPTTSNANTKEDAIRIVDSYANDSLDKCKYNTSTCITMSTGSSSTEIKSTGYLEYEKQGDDYTHYNYTSAHTSNNKKIESTTAYHDGLFYYSNGEKIKIKSEISAAQFEEYLTFGENLPGESKDFSSIKFVNENDTYTLTMSDLKFDAVIQANKYLEKELGYMDGSVDKLKSLKIVATFDKDFNINQILFTIECDSELGVYVKLELDMTDFETNFTPSAPAGSDEYKNVEGAQYYSLAENGLSSLPYANKYSAKSSITTLIKGCNNPYESAYKMTVNKSNNDIDASQEIVRGDEKGTVYSYANKVFTVKDSSGTQSFDYTLQEAEEFASYCIIPATELDFDEIESIKLTESGDSKTIKITPASEYGCDLLNEISKLAYCEHSTITALRENYIEITFTGHNITGVKYRFTTSDGCVAEYSLSYTYKELTAESI